MTPRLAGTLDRDVRRAGERWKMVEQHLVCAHDGGRITAVDLVCTGFRPA